MNTKKIMMNSAVTLACALCLMALPAHAEKPQGAGKPDKAEKSDKGHGGHHESQGGGNQGGNDQGDDDQGRGERHGDSNGGIHFSVEQRDQLRTYYGEQARAGHCPPGLAKKNNGCMPPGQAKQWTRGQPLPKDVIYYDLEPEISVRIGIPPPNYKFVRVAGDILLIAAGTGMVMDAIEDLGKL